MGHATFVGLSHRVSSGRRRSRRPWCHPSWNVPWGSEAWQLRLQCQRLGRHTCGDRSCNCRRCRAAPRKRQDSNDYTEGAWTRIMGTDFTWDPSAKRSEFGTVFCKWATRAIFSEVPEFRDLETRSALRAVQRGAERIECPSQRILLLADNLGCIFAFGRSRVHRFPRFGPCKTLSFYSRSQSLFYFFWRVPSTPLTCRHLVCATR